MVVGTLESMTDALETALWALADDVECRARNRIIGRGWWRVLKGTEGLSIALSAPQVSIFNAVVDRLLDDDCLASGEAET
jgi:hypothetical protein